MLLHSTILAENLAPDAPTIVFLGALGSSTHMWNAQAMALSQVARIVRIDHRGHGNSAAPVAGETPSIADLAADVAETLDSLEIAKAHFVGLSLGGMVAQSFTLTYPSRVESLVLLATGAFMGPSRPWHDRAATARSEGLKGLAEIVVGRWFTTPFAQVNPEFPLKYAAMMAATNIEGYAQCCQAIAAMDLRASITDIHVPTTIIAADADPVTPPAKLKELAASIGQGGTPLAYLEISPAAHLVNVEQADYVNAIIAAHLQRCIHGRQTA